MSGDELDLPLLPSLSFGSESFRDNANAVFESVVCARG